ncbi:MAG: radical SAM family heme chaperone HemW [Gammaproteobacteria bacterium]
MHDVPLSLYVHIPWCIKKCPYCDFNSHEIQNTLPEDQYIDALILDLTSTAQQTKDRKVKSVFIGGGTPSIFTAKSIQRLIKAINDLLELADNVEITIEANPGTADQKNFSGFREAGVNRISIGVQSFVNSQLQNLGRIHDAQTAINSVQTAQQAGFENINIDLMHALPQQSVTTALRDVEQAINLQPTHISYYQLTIEPNTSFYRQPPRLPDSQASWKIQKAGMELLAQHGYQQYEVSAYAKQGFQCVHNTNYWQFGDYLGIGAGAHQKLSIDLPNAIYRCEKPKHPQQYMRSVNTKTPRHILTEEDIIFEFMLNALRLKHGFTKRQFELHTGLSIDLIDDRLQANFSEGLLIINQNRIYCSNRGYKFLDDILQSWLPEPTIT